MKVTKAKLEKRQNGDQSRIYFVIGYKPDHSNEERSCIVASDDEFCMLRVVCESPLSVEGLEEKLVKIATFKNWDIVLSRTISISSVFWAGLAAISYTIDHSLRSATFSLDEKGRIVDVIDSEGPEENPQ
jgi:hypothetical protein